MNIQLKRNLIKSLDHERSIYLSTNVTRISHITRTRFIHDDLTIYVLIDMDSITAAQLSFNPYVTLFLEENKQSFTISGEAVQVKKKADVDKHIRNWNERYSAEPVASNLEGKILIQIRPLRVENFGGQSSESNGCLVFPSSRGLFRRFLRAVFLKVKLWAAIVRAPFFTASITPVILGAAVAYHQYAIFSGYVFALTLLGTVTAHAAANVINDYYDHLSGNDEMNIHHNSFSGGSRMIQNKIITPGSTLFIAGCLFMVTIIIGLILNATSQGNTVLYIGIIGIALAFAYSALPFKLSYRGIGEIAIVASYGPLIVMGTYYVQVQSLDLLPFLASIPNGILVGLILFINEFQDMAADSAAGKQTIVVKMQAKRRSFFIYTLALTAVFIWLIGFTIAGVFPLWTLIILPVAPLVVKAIQITADHYEQISELLPANALTIVIHLGTTLLFSLAFILDRIL